MKFIDWRWMKGLRKLFAAPPREPAQQAQKIVAVQLHIVFPAKVGVVLAVLYYLFDSGWFYGVPATRSLAQDMLKAYFIIYVVCTAVAFVILFRWRRYPAGLFQWLVFTLGLLDGLLMAGLTVFTGGFESLVFWIFPGLIVLNAVSIPLATPQIFLNLLLSLFYLSAGILDATIGFQTWMTPPRQPRAEPRFSVNSTALSLQSSNKLAMGKKANRNDDPAFETTTDEIANETLVLHMFVLWMLTTCCYGVQVLAERQRRALEEAGEFAAREGQLRSAGRLAAEIAHQLKNPLGIINNAVFSLQRALSHGKAAPMDQIRIMQEEIARADRILTDLMGYAQLNEGRVEKLNVAEELDHAIEEVFPAGSKFKVKLERSYDMQFPPLLMQRRHLSVIFVNLLQNAREALNGGGKVSISASCLDDYAIEVAVADSGPGIAPDKLEKVFEAYYTTKEKGTGLGLAIVKHNVELYGGFVQAQSELGKGARFTLLFPGKTSINRPKPNKSS